MKKIYIGGSLFSEGEIAQRLKEEELIKERFGDGFKIYNPISAPFNQDKQTLPTPIDIYEGDVDQLLNTDILICDLGNFYDGGLMLEIGLSAGFNELEELWGETNSTFIIGVLSDIRLPSANKYDIPSFGYNHMVIGAVEKWGVIVHSFEEVLAELEKYLEEDETNG